MSYDELRAEYEKLKVQVAQRQERKSPGEAENPALRELLERLQTLMQAYDQKLAEAQAQIAELQRELFGPKAERLTPEQQGQMRELLQDVEAEGQRPGAESAEVVEARNQRTGARRNVVVVCAIRCPRIWRSRRSRLNRNCAPVPLVGSYRAGSAKKSAKRSIWSPPT
jgi:uncharacterized protein YcbK (DUF882 family)